MKTPFNLEAAKTGAKVVTRDGRKVRIGIWDAKGARPLIGAVDCGKDCDIPKSWTIHGKVYCNEFPSNDDLFMAPATIYVAVRQFSNGSPKWNVSVGYTDARKFKTRPEGWKIMKLVEIESDPE